MKAGKVLAIVVVGPILFVPLIFLTIRPANNTTWIETKVRQIKLGNQYFFFVFVFVFVFLLYVLPVTSCSA